MELKGLQRVLICPLGWGLGHTSRSVPLIQHFLSQNCKVFVAADEVPIAFLKSRFPELNYIHFPSFPVNFSSGKNQVFSLAKIAFRLFTRTYSEQKEIKRLVGDYNIGLIISDNRYGLYSSKVPSILITHQLSVRFPRPFAFLKSIGEWYVRRYAQRFTECWIPDSSNGFSLSGELTKPSTLPTNIKRVGLMSRFNNSEGTGQGEDWDLVAMVSGPFPHRDIFECEVQNIAQRLNLKTLILQGLPKTTNKRIVKGNVTFVPNLPDEEIVLVIRSAKYLICRGGYCTIMDLIALNRSAILVPTPGQTEQEYLAEYLESMGLFKFFTQQEMNRVTMDDLINVPTKLNIEGANFLTLA